MAPIDINKIADKLTRGQRSTIMGLDDTFCILGCSEPTALRLCRDGPQRPALVQMRQGEQYKEFALTAIGMMVKDRIVPAKIDYALL